MFEKATKAVKEVGGTVIGSAKSLGSSIYSTSKEQGEIAGLKVQKSVLEKKLQESYAVIGKRYFDYISESNAENAFDVSDVLEQMQPDIDRINEIDNILIEKELNEKKIEEERREKKALEAYESDKAQLDKALSMDIISQDEYNEKLAMVKKKYDNHEQLRKIEMQLQMGIIDREEYEMKINKVLTN